MGETLPPSSIWELVPDQGKCMAYSSVTPLIYLGTSAQWPRGFMSRNTTSNATIGQSQRTSKKQQGPRLHPWANFGWGDTGREVGNRVLKHTMVRLQARTLTDRIRRGQQQWKRKLLEKRKVEIRKAFPQPQQGKGKHGGGNARKKKDLSPQDIEYGIRNQVS